MAEEQSPVKSLNRWHYFARRQGSRMVINKGADVQMISSVVYTHVQNAKFVRRYGKELLYTLPFEEVGNFSALFSKFESTTAGADQVDFSTTLGIQSYGVSMTSLEEVFMKLEEAEEAKDPFDDDVLHPVDIIVDNRNAATHVRFADETKPLESQNLMEDGPVVIGDQQGIELKPIKKRPKMPKFDEDKPSSEWDKFAALGKLRFKQMLRNKKNVFYQTLLPALLILLGAVFPKFVQQTDPSSELRHKVMPYMFVKNPQDASIPPLIYQNLTGGETEDLVNAIRNQDLETSLVPNGTDFSLIAPNYVGVKVLDFKEESEGYYLNYIALYNDTMVHSIPAVVEIIGNAIYQLVTKESSWRIEATAMMWPDLMTGRTYKYDGMTLMTVLLWGMAMVIIPPGFCGEVATERVSKVKSQLRISGVRWGTYWGTYFLVHVSQFAVCALLTIIIALIIQTDSLTTPGAMVCLVILYLLYIPTLTLLAYILSFLFKKPQTAMTVVSILFIVLAMLPFIIAMMFGVMEGNTLPHMILCFIDPPYAIYGGLGFLELTFLAAVQRNAALGVNNVAPEIPLQEYLKWDNNILVVFIAGIFQLILFSIVLVVLDIKSTGGSITDVFPCIRTKIKPRPSSNPDVPPSEDSDVVNERNKVSSIITDGQDKPPIVLSSLRKSFKTRHPGCCTCRKSLMSPKVPAVRNVSLAIEKGEVFGLLGPNGAGKTTTLNMILAETEPDVGRVFVGGHDIKSSLSEAYQALGYCPQHDPLWEVVTLQEHIECYAAIRGVASQHIEPVTKYFLQALKLEEHAKKKAKALSGGTKRKLCYVLSMLGNAQIVLLDEPSSGLDPKSKRFLWDTISETFSNSDKGAILTTHYMEEADALCSRVGIMVNGLLQCLGSTQHLKGKYGCTYILELKVDASVPTRLEELKERVQDFVIEHFPHAILSEGFGNMCTYKILKEDMQSLAKVFTALEEGKSKLSIEEYSFSQSTLEQVFLSFAKTQLLSDEVPAAGGVNV